MTKATARGIAWPMTVLTSLFFMWGFLTVMNDVLVPHWKEAFQLSYAQSLLVQFCFFGAYFLGSMLYYFSSLSGADPIQRFGYKRAAVGGLLLSATACLLFIPASYSHSYSGFLLALFMLGLGFTLLQIAANPFVAIIGSAEGASSRLNLAQAFNSLGTTLAPLVGGWLIFERFQGDAAIRYPYAVYAGLFVLLAIWVQLTPLPEPPRAEEARGNALRHRSLRLAMIAIFCYVGAEVTIGSLIINFLKLPEVMGLPEKAAKNYLSLYWGGAMTGRFLGAIALAKGWPMAKRVLAMVAVGAAMFILLVALNAGSALGLEQAWPMALLILLNMAAFVLAGPNASRALGLFATVAALVLLGIVVAGEGLIAVWAIIAIGLFNSIMWSNIFTLAIDGLGEDTAQGSSLLVMMIVGGALVPPLQGRSSTWWVCRTTNMTRVPRQIRFCPFSVMPTWLGTGSRVHSKRSRMILASTSVVPPASSGLVHRRQGDRASAHRHTGHADDRAFADAPGGRLPAELARSQRRCTTASRGDRCAQRQPAHRHHRDGAQPAVEARCAPGAHDEPTGLGVHATLGERCQRRGLGRMALRCRPRLERPAGGHARHRCGQRLHREWQVGAGKRRQCWRTGAHHPGCERGAPAPAVDADAWRPT
jgi:FHS family L-fucose permease-like MFS transporter